MKYLFAFTLTACVSNIKIGASSQPVMCFHPYGMTNAKCRVMEVVNEGSINGQAFRYRLRDCGVYGTIYSPANVEEVPCD